jgi:hypothetical protein
LLLKVRNNWLFAVMPGKEAAPSSVIGGNSYVRASPAAAFTFSKAKKLNQELKILAVHVVDQVSELFVQKYIPRVRGKMRAVHDKTPLERRIRQYEVRRESCQRSLF